MQDQDPHQKPHDRATAQEEEFPVGFYLQLQTWRLFTNDSEYGGLATLWLLHKRVSGHPCALATEVMCKADWNRKKGGTGPHDCTPELTEVLQPGRKLATVAGSGRLVITGVQQHFPRSVPLFSP